MKKHLFLFFLSSVNSILINTISCQANEIYLKRDADLLNEFEKQLENYNWKPPLYNEENVKLEQMINALEAMKLKIDIAEKLEYNDKVKFKNEFNNLEEKIKTMKNKTIPDLKEINLNNINAIFNFIHFKITKYIDTLKSKITDNKNKTFFIEKISKSELIDKFFTAFPKETISTKSGQPENQVSNENCVKFDCDILNVINKILHYFHTIEQMKIANETESEIANKKIEFLHKIWTKLWKSDLNTIFQSFKNPNENLITK